jgi:hypothetical protein
MSGSRRFIQDHRPTGRMTMKKIAILAAIVAVSAATSAFADTMPQGHSPGGPIKQGKYCWVSTDSRGAGWWDVCDSTSREYPRAASLRGHPFYDDQIMGGGDGGGGGGGGGGR